jgi:hypothetical protein
LRIEVAVQQEMELELQQVLVPAGELGKPVVGNHIGPLLGLRHRRERDRRNRPPAEQPCCLDAAMAGNDPTLIIDKNRIHPAELLQALRNLPDLLLRMRAGVVFPGRERCQRPLDDRKAAVAGGQYVRVSS